MVNLKFRVSHVKICCKCNTCFLLISQYHYLIATNNLARSRGIRMSYKCGFIRPNIIFYLAIDRYN